MTIDLIEAGKLLLATVTAGAAGWGAWIALNNWRVASRNVGIANENAVLQARWKRAELAASYLRPLLEDEELVFALRCIDWAVGDIPVPARHRAMMKKETIRHDPALLATAMVPRLTWEVAENPQAMLYRLTIDALFTRLDWIGHRVASGLITIEDIPDIKYWMSMLALWPLAPDGRDGRTVFVPFLEAAQYDATLGLMRRFGALDRPGEA